MARMKPEQFETLNSNLQTIASSLVTAPELPTLLAHLEGIPQALAGLGDFLVQGELPSTESTRIQHSARESLLHLQRALIYVHSRLQHEHQSLRMQLSDLAAQLEWAERARQST